MATFLDITLLEHFRVILYFIFIFAILYAFMIVVFKEKLEKNIIAIIAFAMSLIVVLSQSTREIIDYVAPSFFIVMLLIFFAILIYTFIGGKEQDFRTLISGREDSTKNFIIAIVVIIALGALGRTFFAEGSPFINDGRNRNITDTDPSSIGETGEEEFVATITHPKVLGMIALLLVGWGAVLFLSMTQKVTKMK